MRTRSERMALGFAAALAFSTLVGCGGGGCGSGAGSSVGAVEGLLGASGADEQCVFLPESKKDAGPEWLISVDKAVGSLDPAKLQVTEAASRQMGREHVVVIAGPDGTMDVVVMDSDDKFVVLPGGEPTAPG